ncbi:MAG: hypothetical protein NTZ84_03865 [Candidatus Nealsonbacteria bacterium]|nr:hypothetical protein [Candidatus Nealsonbacteria bacterium]
MNEIEEMLIKIKDKGCAPMLLGTPNLKEKARRLMAVFPETSFWDLKTIEELFQRVEHDFKKPFLSDAL